MANSASVFDRFNFRIPGRRWQLFEFSDFWIVPSFIKHDLQDVADAKWRTRIPLLQAQSAAELAADSVSDVLRDLPDLETANWTIVDFGSGQGGPVPIMDMLVNHGRHAAGKKPLPFQLSDLHPNLDAWIELASRSASLSFIPQPVDAGHPTFPVLSATARGDHRAAAAQGYDVDQGHRVLRLYCNAFHRFDDPAARRVLRSTLDTSDAFAIVELRERTAGSLLLVWLETALLFLLALTWFWHDGVHLLLTYVFPLLPVTQLLDELVACLRVRTFADILELVAELDGEKTGHKQSLSTSAGVVRRGDWEFRHQRVLWMWPCGYMNVISGVRT